MNEVTTQQVSDAAEPVSMTELAAFAGNSDYAKDWEKYHGENSSSAGFNAWAAIFGVQWFFYRQLYMQGLVAAFFELGMPVGFLLLARFSLGMDASQQYSGIVGFCAVVIFVLTKIAIGYWANIIFYKKAVRTIQKINQLNLDNERHLSVIGSLGQPSFLAVILLDIGLGILKVVIEVLR